MPRRDGRPSAKEKARIVRWLMRAYDAATQAGSLASDAGCQHGVCAEINNVWLMAARAVARVEREA